MSLHGQPWRLSATSLSPAQADRRSTTPSLRRGVERGVAGSDPLARAAVGTADADTEHGADRQAQGEPYRHCDGEPGLHESRVVEDVQELLKRT